MKVFGKLALILAAGLLLSACMGNVKTYVDPQYHHASFTSIHPAAHPVTVNVATHFEQNGKAKPSVDPGLRSDVVSTLTRSGVFHPVADDAPANGTITVTANNLANLDAAQSKGRSTGLTLGASGATVQDPYVFDVSYQGHNGPSFRHTYKHRLISTIGSTQGPEGIKPTNLAEGFRQVVQDVVLDALGAVACLHDGVVADADQLDAGVIFGTGFAPFRGGPIQYIRDTGADTLRTQLEHLAERHGERFKPREGWDAPALRHERTATPTT